MWFYARVNALARAPGPPMPGLKKSGIYSGRLGVRPTLPILEAMLGLKVPGCTSVARHPATQASMHAVFVVLAISLGGSWYYFYNGRPSYRPEYRESLKSVSKMSNGHF